MGMSLSCLKTTGCGEDDGQSASSCQQREDDGQSASSCQQREDDGQSASSCQQRPLSGEQQRKIDECINLFKEGKEKWDIDALILGIHDLLDALLNSEQSQPEKPSTRSSSGMFFSLIHSGGKFLKFVNGHIVKEDIEKTRSKDNFLSIQGIKTLSNILQYVGNIHWIVAGLAVVGYVISKFAEVSENNAECLDLLKWKVELIKHIRNLNPRKPEEVERLKDALLLIFQGCIMCASLIQSGKYFRFLKTSVNSEMLKRLRSKMDILHGDLMLTVLIRIDQNVESLSLAQPTYLPLRQPTYPKCAVGLEKHLDKITQMFKDGVEVIVIFGPVGSRKTTLGRAIVSKLNVECIYYTKIIFEEYQNDFTRKQLQLLNDVFPEYQRILNLRHSEEGRDHLTEAFKSEQDKPVFIFIQNVRCVDDLKNLLPEDLSLSQCSKILVTTTDPSITNFFDDCCLSCEAYEMQRAEIKQKQTLAVLNTESVVSCAFVPVL